MKETCSKVKENVIPVNRKFHDLTLHMEFIELVRQDFVNIFTSASHSCKYKKKFLSHSWNEFHSQGQAIEYPLYPVYARINWVAIYVISYFVSYTGTLSV